MKRTTKGAEIELTDEQIDMVRQHAAFADGDELEITICDVAEGLIGNVRVKGQCWGQKQARKHVAAKFAALKTA